MADIPDRAYQLSRLALVLASLAVAGVVALAIYCAGGDGSAFAGAMASLPP